MNETVNVYDDRVRAHQTDLNAAMHHGAYFDLFDDARIETFRRLGYDYKRMQSTRYRPLIRRIDCEYYLPAYMDDALRITVTVERMSAATMSIRYDCRREESLLAVGHATFVFVDAAGKPVRVPSDLRGIAEEHLMPQSDLT